VSDYVFNSASVAERYPVADTARVHLKALLGALALLDADSAQLPSLRLNIDPWAQPLVDSVPPITLGALAHSFYGTKDRDLAAFFDSLSRMIPADEALDNVSLEAILRFVPEAPAPSLERAFAGVLAAGTDALICAVMDFTLVGLLRSDLWNFDRAGFISETAILAFDHVADVPHAQAIRQRRLAGLSDALTVRSFWRLKEMVFPNLLFGVDVENNINVFSATLMPLMFKRLSELNSRAGVWRESAAGEFPDGPTKIKPESPETMNRYGTRRNFRGYDGVIRTFEDHLRIDGLHRIHVYMHGTERNERKLEIGYIGRHLPTMTDPT